MDNSWKHNFYNMLSLSESLSDEPAKIAYEYKNKFLPKKLYRYRSLNKAHREKQNLENNKLYLSSPKDFNDPYDCECKLNYHLIIYYVYTSLYLESFSTWKAEIFKKSSLDYRAMIENCPHYRKSYLNKYKEHHNVPKFNTLISDIKDDILISCFSETYNSVLMWSHYADEHRGICIEYDLQDLYGNIQFTFNRAMYPVIYNRTLADVTQLAIDTIFKKSSKHVLNYVLIKPAVHKAIDWRYEQEWRIIFPRINTREIETPTPSKIILGSRISKVDEEWLRDLCEQKSIKVVKAAHSTIYHSINIT